jgi:hypothetical protein
MSEAHFAILRRHMVEVIGIHVDLASEELGKAILDERVLAAMRKVPRHRFVVPSLAPRRQAVRLPMSKSTIFSAGRKVPSEMRSSG